MWQVHVTTIWRNDHIGSLSHHSSIFQVLLLSINSEQSLHFIGGSISRIEKCIVVKFAPGLSSYSHSLHHNTYMRTRNCFGLQTAKIWIEQNCRLCSNIYLNICILLWYRITDSLKTFDPLLSREVDASETVFIIICVYIIVGFGESITNCVNDPSFALHSAAIDYLAIFARKPWMWTGNRKALIRYRFLHLWFESTRGLRMYRWIWNIFKRPHPFYFTTFKLYRIFAIQTIFHVYRVLIWVNPSKVSDITALVLSTSLGTPHNTKCVMRQCKSRTLSNFLMNIFNLAFVYIFLAHNR